MALKMANAISVSFQSTIYMVFTSISIYTISMNQASGEGVSMAKLQGYFVHYADSFDGAFENLRSLEGKSSSSSEAAVVNRDDSNSAPFRVEAAPRRRTVGTRRLTVEEIDKMVFNPQEGWDKDIRDISS